MHCLFLALKDLCKHSNELIYMLMLFCYCYQYPKYVCLIFVNKDEDLEVIPYYVSF